MSKNRYINTEFWTDEYIENLEPLDKYLFLYCLTNPLANIAGIYKISLTRITFETGLDKKSLLKAFEGFKNDNKILYLEGWLACKNTIKHQKINENIKTGINKIINNAPRNIIEWACGNFLKEDNESLYIDFESLLKASNYINLNINSNINLNSKEEKKALEDKKKKNEKLKNQEIIIEEIYKKYPYRCKINGRSTNKNKTCKNKIKILLENGKNKTELIKDIELYENDCIKTDTPMKNFETFLNNIPDRAVYNIPIKKKEKIFKTKKQLDDEAKDQAWNRELGIEENNFF